MEVILERSHTVNVKHSNRVYLAGAEKSPQRSEFDWTTVLELLLSSSSSQPERQRKGQNNIQLIKSSVQTYFTAAWNWSQEAAAD